MITFLIRNGDTDKFVISFSYSFKQGYLYIFIYMLCKIRMVDHGGGLKGDRAKRENHKEYHNIKKFIYPRRSL